MSNTYAWSNIIVTNFDKIIEHFDLEIYDKGKYWQGFCFHGSDNPTSFTMYPDNRIWLCHTQQCQEKWGRSLIGFMRGLLSTVYHKEFSFLNTFSWLESFFGKKLSKVEQYNKVRRELSIQTDVLNGHFIENPYYGIPRNLFLRKLKIPSQYYLDRGYSSEILKKYDIGEFTDKNHPMYHRAVIPIYNQDHTRVVAYSGRSIFNRCKKCKGFHNPNHECDKTVGKWKHSFNFQKNNYLFNYWFAKEHIKKSKIVILVEGIGDSLRLSQYNIYNNLALFGTKMSVNQRRLIDGLGVRKIVLLLDNGLAGQKGKEDIKKQYNRYYYIVCPEFPSEDIGEANFNDIERYIKPYVEN